MSGRFAKSIGIFVIIIITSIFVLSSNKLAAFASTLLTTIQVHTDGEAGIAVVDSQNNLAYVTVVPSDASQSFVSVINTVNDNVVTNIPLGAQPGGMGINELTRRVYVSNHFLDTVSVIDAQTNTISSVISGNFDSPREIAVNEQTNTVYVTNIKGGGQLNPGFVTIIDGATNGIVGTIQVGSDPRSVAVNPITNRVYVSAAGNDPGLTVIDGTTNQIIDSLNFSLVSAAGVDVDTVLNRIYITNNFLNNVYVVDGYTNTIITSILVHPVYVLRPHSIVIDSATRLGYVTSEGDDPTGSLVTVIDLSTNTVVEQIILGTNVRPSTHDIDFSLAKLYVPLRPIGNPPGVAVVSIAANSVPTAHAGDDRTVLVGDLVTLDGSNSSDPDLNPLTYLWSENPANPETGLLSDPNIVNPIFTPSLPGLYQFSLTVNDGFVDSNPDNVEVTVQTPSEAIDDLIDAVGNFNLQQGIDNSFDAKLDTAIQALSDTNQNNDTAAINSLNAFINSVEAQRGNELTDEQADALIAAANTILNSLNN